MNNNFNYGTFNNEKKWCKSHFLLYIVSFMFVMSAMLCINPDWLNKYYDTTLCASSTAPTIDSTYFDYKNPNFLNNFDFVTDNTVNYYASVQSLYYINQKVVVNNINNNSRINGSFVSGMYFGPSSPNSSYTFAGTFDYSYYNISYTNISNVIFETNTSVGNYINIRSSSVSSTNLFGMYPVVYVFTKDNVYYTVCNSALYNKYLAYREGVSAGAGAYDDGYNAGYTAGQVAGEQSGYNNGYNAGYTEGEGVGYNSGWREGIDTGYQNGQNSVINHPGDYDLYTKQQYDNNYNIGYQNGLTDVTNNPDEFDLYTKDEFDGNYTAGYNNGLDVGEQAGYSSGYGVGYNDGESAGYTDGYNASMNGKSSFKDLMFAIFDAPFNVLSSAFNFEIFGINLSYFLITIVSLLLVAFVIRKLL